MTIPWASRGVLLQRFRQEGGAGEVIRAFEAVGSSKPVRLDAAGKRRLLETCSGWLDEPGGVDALPDGILDLRNALEDEKAHGELGEDESPSVTQLRAR